MSRSRKHEPEPLVRRADETRQVALDVLNIVQLGRERVLDVDNDDLPVGFTLIEEGHDAEDFNLLDLTDITDLLADLADIEGVVVALRLRLSMLLGRVLPRLREGAVVPDVTVVGEAVADVTGINMIN
jgi:hypothetical protein